MRTFNYKKLKNEKRDSEIISYIAKIYQEQGKRRKAKMEEKNKHFANKRFGRSYEKRSFAKKAEDNSEAPKAEEHKSEKVLEEACHKSGHDCKI